jgi:Holliday junction resolvase
VTNYAQRGRKRERQVAEKLRADGWVVIKGTSYGCADLIALKDGERPWLVEVKSTSAPYETFRGPDRTAMVSEAARAGADAVLAHWPMNGALRLIFHWEWPAPKPKAVGA